MTELSKAPASPASIPPKPEEPAKPPTAADLQRLAAAKPPALGEPPASPVKPAPAPATAPPDDLQKIVRDAVREAIKPAEDVGLVPDILPAVAPDLPKAEDLDRLFQDGKQGEAMQRAIAAAAAQSTPATARLMRIDAFREMERNEEIGPVYQKHRKRIHEALVAMRLTDAHLSNPQAVDAAVRLIVSQSPDMFDDLAAQRARRRAAPGPSAPASAAAPATGPAPAGTPGARVEVPGAAPESTAPAVVDEAMDVEERTMWIAMGIDPAKVSEERAKLRNVGKPGGPPARTAYGVEV